MELRTEPEADRRASNRRREHRYRCFKTARIHFNAGFTVFDCTVRNISNSGAMLEMETLLGIPKKFELILEYGESPRPCEVRWRTDKRMGVLFAETAGALAA
ncbi:MAG TPA: PilZ domain-containing protein [Bauldia sp.]|nr:PilZ domain-containing protein [Bauldia sp.]